METYLNFLSVFVGILLLSGIYVITTFLRDTVERHLGRKPNWKELWVEANASDLVIYIGSILVLVGMFYVFNFEFGPFHESRELKSYEYVIGRSGTDYVYKTRAVNGLEVVEYKLSKEVADYYQIAFFDDYDKVRPVYYQRWDLFGNELEPYLELHSYHPLEGYRN